MKKTYITKKSVKLFAKAFIGFAFIGLGSFNAKAQQAPTIVAAQSGNWSATTTWVGGVVPNSKDSVIIGGTYTVTVDGNDSCLDLTLGDGASNGTVLFSASNSLTVDLALTIGNGSGTGSIDMTNGGTLNLTTYTVPAGGAWTAGTGTVSFNYTMASSLYVFPGTFFSSYYNLTINAVSSSMIRSNLPNVTVINSLNLQSGTFDIHGTPLSVGDISGAGNITNTGAPATLTTGGDTNSTTVSGIISGAIALVKNNGGTLTLSGANTYTEGTTLNSGVLNLNNPTAIGTGVLTINGGQIDNTTGSVTLTNNNAQVWNGNFTFKGTDNIYMGNGPITLGGDVTISLTGTGVLTEAGAINDNVNSLYIAGTGSMQFAGQAIQVYNFGVLSGSFNTAGSNLSIAGNFSNSGTFNDGTGTEVFNGTSSQNIHGNTRTTFYNIILNNTGNLYINQSSSITNQLTLTAGQIILGSDSLTLSGTCSISGASSSNYIVTNNTGTLNKVFTGLGSFSFPVGDNNASGDYTPINITINSGNFPATIYVGSNPVKDIHNNSSLNYTNRYWNVNQNGLGTFNATIAATYLASDVAGTESSIACGLWPGSYPWVKYGSVNSTTHTINETVTSFGDIAGITLAAPTVGVTPTTVCLTSNTITATTTGDDAPVSYSWSSGETTSSAFPTSSGTYTVTITDGNGITAAQSVPITVNVPTIALSSALGTDVQAVCANDTITRITYNISGGVTGATVSTLPNGITSSFIGNLLTISGTPTMGGVYTYTVTTTGGSCGPQATASGTITVNAPSIVLTSAPGTDAQSACLNNALTNIKYYIGGTAAGATVTGLPSGINYSFNADTVTISGTPSVSGITSYTVSTSGGSCGTTTATGSISVGSLSLALTSNVGSDAQTVCYNSSISNITYAAGGTATSATVTGLPNGVNSSFSGGTVTITGKPATGGVYTYTVTAIGGECAPTAIGTITVNQPSLKLISAAGTDNQLICQGTPVATIKYAINSTATGATVSGLPNGVNYLVNNDTVTISGIPADSGTFNYTVFTTGSPCGVGTINGIIQISSPFANLSSSFGTDAQAVCAGTTITDITYDIGGLATGATVSGLPTGVSSAYNNGLLTISGTPTVGGAYSYTVTTTGGLCNPATASGTITVNAPVLKLVSASSTDNQVVCANTAINNIVYAYGGTTVGTSISGLPTGLSTSSVNDTLTISGIPTDTGTFTYTINTIGSSCSSIMVTGTITINSPILSLSSGVNTDNQTLCGDTHMANITYNVNGGATGASVAGLPSGVNFSYISGTLTISGSPTNSGAFPYIVSTTGGGCGSAVANGSITVNASPTVTVKGVAGLRAGTNDTLVASGATSYVWLNNGVLTDTNIVTPTTNTIYTVVGTTGQGCTDTVKFFVTINTVGVNELSQSTTISLYPNPAFDVLNISFDAVSDNSAVIKVIDITGKEIMSTNSAVSNGKIVRMDINSLAQGLYFVKVITPHNSQIIKFIKQ